MDKGLAKVQVVIAIIATLYVVMPDLFVGPIDDAVIATIAVIMESVLGIMRAISSAGSNLLSDFEDEFY